MPVCMPPNRPEMPQNSGNDVQKSASSLGTYQCAYLIFSVSNRCAPAARSSKSSKYSASDLILAGSKQGTPMSGGVGMGTLTEIMQVWELRLKPLRADLTLYQQVRACMVGG